MRLLVCGSRTWTDQARLRHVLDQLVSEHSDGQVVTVIEGDARGADRLAGQLARERGWRLERYPADWTRHGRAAGFRRNARMLQQGRPDLVVAFTVGPLAGSRGTADMVRRARVAGVPVQVVTSDHPEPS
jgi:YspA, cpYpsA-related SLOG family